MTVSHEIRLSGTAACGADKRFRSPSTSKTRRSGSLPDMSGIALAPMSGVGPDSCHQFLRSPPPPFTREEARALCTTKVFVVGCPSRVSQGDEPRGMGGYRVTRTEFSAARRGAAGRAFPPIGPSFPGIFKPPLTWTPRLSQNQELTGRAGAFFERQTA